MRRDLDADSVVDGITTVKMGIIRSNYCQGQPTWHDCCKHGLSTSSCEVSEKVQFVRPIPF